MRPRKLVAAFAVVAPLLVGATGCKDSDFPAKDTLVYEIKAGSLYSNPAKSEDGKALSSQGLVQTVRVKPIDYGPGPIQVTITNDDTTEYAVAFRADCEAKAAEAHIITVPAKEKKPDKKDEDKNKVTSTIRNVVPGNYSVLFGTPKSDPTGKIILAAKDNLKEANFSVVVTASFTPLPGKSFAPACPSAPPEPSRSSSQPSLRATR